MAMGSPQTYNCLSHTIAVYSVDNFHFHFCTDVKEEMSVKLKPAASVGFPYDYQSVMHYPWLQIKDGKTNIMYPIWVTSIYCFTSTKNSVWESNALRGSPSASQSTNDGWAMGHWQGLSSTDVQKLNLLYFKQCVQRREHANELLRKKKINK
uniref:SFRICE_006041 n=1 Tax=Spodoptera frugiperda TaxID=7108 RepID=A0A2H1WVL9_SPOFR